VPQHTAAYSSKEVNAENVAVIPGTPFRYPNRVRGKYLTKVWVYILF
jgi:hypothetical protein